MSATINHFTLTKQLKYKFHSISYPWIEDQSIWVRPHGFDQQIIYSIDNKSLDLMTNYCDDYCNKLSRFSCEISVLQLKGDSLISNVIYEAMTATFCPLYREFPYIEFPYFERP